MYCHIFIYAYIYIYIYIYMGPGPLANQLRSRQSVARVGRDRTEPFWQRHCQHLKMNPISPDSVEIGMLL